MVGYVGLTADPERVARFERLVEAGALSTAHREDGFAIALRRPPATGEQLTHRSEIAADPWHLLAFEGYLADDAARAMQPAAWLLDEHARTGTTAFENLNGAYALCLFDRRTRRAAIGACSFGRRDLYYLREGDGLVFATDLELLLQLAASRPELATDQMSSTFLCGAMYGGGTLLKGVRRALPGSLVRVTPGAVEETPPAPLPPALRDAPSSEEEALDELDGCLRVAVARLRSVTARRVVLMSAGVDSPLVAAYVKAVTGELDALTLAMPWPPDESERAGAIVRALGGEHHTCSFGIEDPDLLADMDEFVRVMEEPVSFGLGLLMTHLARAARARGDGFVCGVSADALFGDPVQQPDDPSSNSIYHYMYREIAPESMRRVVRLKGPHPDTIVRRLRARLSHDPERQHLRLPLLLQNGLMIRAAARLARFHDGEALYPYLDRDVVDLASRLPAGMRERDKPLLRKLAMRHYGAELQRPGKVPFTAYPIAWLHAGGRLGALLDFLDEQRTRERGVYRERALRRLIESYRAGQPERHWNLILWQLAVFELFCRRFVDSDQLDASAAA